ncbi:BCCT family transporter [Salinicola sp. NYA28a]
MGESANRLPFFVEPPLFFSSPVATITSVGVILVIMFFVTSSGSGSLVIDSLTAGGKTDASVSQRAAPALVFLPVLRQDRMGRPVGFQERGSGQSGNVLKQIWRPYLPWIKLSSADEVHSKGQRQEGVLTGTNAAGCGDTGMHGRMPW